MSAEPNSKPHPDADPSANMTLEELDALIAERRATMPPLGKNVQQPPPPPWRLPIWRNDRRRKGV